MTRPPLKGSTKTGSGTAAHLTRKCPGKLIPARGKAQFAAHRDVEDGQGDRDSQAAVEDVVEVAVARVVVAVGVTAESLLDGEETAQLGNGFTRSETFHARLDLGGEAADAPQAGTDVEVGVGVAGDQQGSASEIDAAVRLPDQVVQGVCRGRPVEVAGADRFHGVCTFSRDRRWIAANRQREQSGISAAVFGAAFL